MVPFVSLEVFPQAINPATVKGKAAGLQAQVLQMGKGVPSSPSLGTSRGQGALREPVVQGLIHRRLRVGGTITPLVVL